MIACVTRISLGTFAAAHIDTYIIHTCHMCNLKIKDEENKLTFFVILIGYFNGFTIA